MKRVEIQAKLSICCKISKNIQSYGDFFTTNDKQIFTYFIAFINIFLILAFHLTMTVSFYSNKTPQITMAHVSFKQIYIVSIKLFSLFIEKWIRNNLFHVWLLSYAKGDPKKPFAKPSKFLNSIFPERYRSLLPKLF